MHAIALILLLFPPIPAAPEGTIAVAYRSPKPELRLVRTNGQEIRKVALPDVLTLDGIRHSKSAAHSLVTFRASTVSRSGIRHAIRHGSLVTWEGEGSIKSLVSSRAGLTWAFSRDGRTVYGSDVNTDRMLEANGGWSSWSLDLESGAVKPLAIPAGSSIVDGTTDEEELLVMPHGRVDQFAALVKLPKLDSAMKLENSTGAICITANGQMIVTAVESTLPKGQTSTLQYVTLDRRTGKTTAFKNSVEGSEIHSATVSPDGRRIAVIRSRKERQPNGLDETVFRLDLSGLDGSEPKTIIRTTGRETIGDIDWR